MNKSSPENFYEQIKKSLFEQVVPVADWKPDQWKVSYDHVPISTTTTTNNTFAPDWETHRAGDTAIRKRLLELQEEHRRLEVEHGVAKQILAALAAREGGSLHLTEAEFDAALDADVILEDLDAGGLMAVHLIPDFIAAQQEEDEAQPKYELVFDAATYPGPVASNFPVGGSK